MSVSTVTTAALRHSELRHAVTVTTGDSAVSSDDSAADTTGGNDFFSLDNLKDDGTFAGYLCPHYSDATGGSSPSSPAPPVTLHKVVAKC